MLLGWILVMLFVRTDSMHQVPSREDIVFGRGRRPKELSGIVAGGMIGLLLTGFFRLSRIDLGASLWALIARIVVDFVEVPNTE